MKQTPYQINPKTSYNPPQDYFSPNLITNQLSPEQQYKYQDPINTYSNNVPHHKNQPPYNPWPKDIRPIQVNNQLLVVGKVPNQIPQLYQQSPQSANKLNSVNGFSNHYVDQYSPQIRQQKLKSPEMVNSLIFPTDNKPQSANGQTLNSLFMNLPTKQKRMPRGSEPLIKNNEQIPNRYDNHHLQEQNKKVHLKKNGTFQMVERSQQVDLTQNKQFLSKMEDAQQKPNTESRKRTQITRRSSIDVMSMRAQMLQLQSLQKDKKKDKFTVQNFQKIKELGNGKYGRVLLVRQKRTNFICALKLIQKKLLREQEITEQFIRELKIQSYLNHPNIIKMYGFFQDSTNFYIILEVATGGQFYDVLEKAKALSETKVAYYMRQICDAVREIHALRIIHRDIKPQNIVMHENVIKLCDFGWSVRQDSNLRTTFCGTPLYVCPQILKGHEYDEKIDIWSLGVMAYQMIVGENPFKITKQQQLIKIIKDEVKVPSWVNVSKQAQHLLYSCLRKNPNERLHIREIIQHDFFKKNPDKQADKNKIGF